MSAFGQPAPAPAAPAAPTNTPAAPAQAAGGTAPAPGADPFGFAGLVQNTPEHLRPMLETHLQTIAPQFSQFEPLLPMMERLGPLLTPDESGHDTLEGLIELYSMFGDESKLDQLAEWWDQVGEEFNLFGEEEPSPGAAATPATPAAAAPAAGEVDLSGVDPAIASVIQSLQQQVQDQAAQVAELTNGLQSSAQEQAANTAAENIRTELVTGMKAAGIKGHEDLKSEESTDILRMAMGFGEDPQAIPKAVARYAQLTGARPPAPGIDPQLDGVAALQAALNGGGIATSQGGGGGHGAALGPGNAAHEPEPVRGWDDARAIALQRLRADQAMG